MIDSHDILIAHVDQRSLFGGDRREADALAGIFDGEQSHLVVHGADLTNPAAALLSAEPI
ncbi:hypothetical protein [Streptomyces sp. JH34]|uniref:hypothetical protein n=1 Tax=unclassified Streptomyces TaxID=2593676 RepID=UPI003211F097